MPTQTNHTPAAAPAAPAEPSALIQLARDIEAMKRECGMDPESPTAIYNGRLMGIAYRLRTLASQTTAPALSEPVGEVATDGGIDWVLDGQADWEPGTKVYLAAPNQTPAPAAQGLPDAAYPDMDGDAVPDVGSKWGHSNGDTYTVTGYADMFSHSHAKRPPRVIYRSEKTGRVWSRPLSDWYENHTALAASRTTPTPCPDCGARSGQHYSRCPATTPTPGEA